MSWFRQAQNFSFGSPAPIPGRFSLTWFGRRMDVLVEKDGFAFRAWLSLQLVYAQFVLWESPWRLTKSLWILLRLRESQTLCLVLIRTGLMGYWVDMHLILNKLNNRSPLKEISIWKVSYLSCHLRSGLTQFDLRDSLASKSVESSQLRS